MNTDTITFKAIRRNTEYTFCLRDLTQADEDDYQQGQLKYADKKGEERAEAVYRHNVNALASWSDKMPLFLDYYAKPAKAKAATAEGEQATESVELKPQPIGKGDISETIKEHFKERTRRNEWIVNDAVNVFRNSMYTSVVFQKPSE